MHVPHIFDVIVLKFWILQSKPDLNKTGERIKTELGNMTCMYADTTSGHAYSSGVLSASSLTVMPSVAQHHLRLVAGLASSYNY